MKKINNFGILLLTKTPTKGPRLARIYLKDLFSRADLVKTKQSYFEIYTRFENGEKGVPRLEDAVNTTNIYLSNSSITL